MLRAECRSPGKMQTARGSAAAAEQEGAQRNTKINAQKEGLGREPHHPGRG